MNGWVMGIFHPNTYLQESENQRKCLSMHLLHLLLIIATFFCMGCPTNSLTNCRDFWTPHSTRLVFNAPRFCHISLLCGLHWLPVKVRIQFKILLITFKAIQGLAPKYLCELLTFKSSLYNLKSSGSILLFMPAVRSKTTLGDKAFMAAAPTLLNSLPKELRAITNVNSFKAHIKTYVFRTVYWWSILYSFLTCMHIYSFYFFIFKCIIFYLFLVK